MALGLESNIAETAKAFQGNPQALQQRYTQKQDLFDLLALNMIKKQQAAAKNQLLMSQQEMPGTIIEQMENAVTKNESGEANTQTETATGVAGALATKNAQTQSNMNKMAGVASNSAANMKTLAGGGIVGFAGGGEVTAELLKKMNISRKDFNSLPKETQDTLVSSIAASAGDDDSQLSSDIDSFLGPKERRRIIQAAADKTTLDAPGFFSQAGEYIFGDKESYKDVTDKRNAAEERKKYLTNLANTDKPQYNEPGGLGTSFNPIPGAGKMKPRDQSSLSGIAAVTPEITEKKDDKPVIPGVGVDSFGKDKSGGAPAVGGFDASKYAADDGFNTQVKGGISDLLNSDPKKAVDFAARTPAEQAFMAKMLKERSDMRDNMMNPDKLSNDRLMQTLLGAKGATPGEAFRTSGLAGVNAERNQEKLKRSEFDALNKLYMTEADKSQGIKQKAFEGSQADKKQGVASGSSLTANEQTRALEADKLVSTISNNAAQTALKKDLNSIQKQRNSILESGNIMQGNTKMVQLYEKAASDGVKTLTAAATKTKATNFGADKAAKDKLIDDKLAADIKKLQDGVRLKAAPFRDALKKATTKANTKTGGMAEVDKILNIGQ